MGKAYIVQKNDIIRIKLKLTDESENNVSLTNHSLNIDNYADTTVSIGKGKTIGGFNPKNIYENRDIETGYTIEEVTISSNMYLLLGLRPVYNSYDIYEISIVRQ